MQKPRCKARVVSNAHGTLLDYNDVVKLLKEAAPQPEPWVVSRPGVHGGKPCVRGTRVTVETLQAVAKEWTIFKIVLEYPHVPLAGLAAALAYKLPTGRRFYAQGYQDKLPAKGTKGRSNV
jgi:uncharacterized protein (DUF433 family)